MAEVRMRLGQLFLGGLAAAVGGACSQGPIFVGDNQTPISLDEGGFDDVEEMHPEAAVEAEVGPPPETGQGSDADAVPDAEGGIPPKDDAEVPVTAQQLLDIVNRGCDQLSKGLYSAHSTSRRPTVGICELRGVAYDWNAGLDVVCD